MAKQRIVFVKLLMIDKPVHVKIAIYTCLISSEKQQHTHTRLHFDPGNKTKFYIRRARKRMLNFVKHCKIWLTNVVKYGKYSLVNLTNFVIVLCVGKGTTFALILPQMHVVILSRVQHKHIQNSKTSLGYIFSISSISLPNFAMLLILRCFFQLP